MKHTLFFTGTILLVLAIAGISLLWPELVIWVAWMLVALFIFSGKMLSEQISELEASRDRWQGLELKMEREVGRLQGQLAYRQTEIEDLGRLVRKCKQLLARQDAELARLRPYTDPRLFAAASDVLEVAGKGSDEQVDLALVMLAEAVAWWDALPGVGVELPLEAVERIAAGENPLAVLTDAGAEEVQRGPDPDCPNCDGTGGALPGGACGVCWNWDPDKYPDRVDGKWPEVDE